MRISSSSGGLSEWVRKSEGSKGVSPASSARRLTSASSSSCEEYEEGTTKPGVLAILLHRLSEWSRVDTHFVVQSFSPNLHKRRWVWTPVILSKQFGFRFHSHSRSFRITGNIFNIFTWRNTHPLSFRNRSFKGFVSSLTLFNIGL